MPTARASFENIECRIPLLVSFPFFVLGSFSSLIFSLSPSDPDKIPCIHGQMHMYIGTQKVPGSSDTWYSRLAGPTCVGPLNSHLVSMSSGQPSDVELHSESAMDGPALVIYLHLCPTFDPLQKGTLHNQLVFFYRTLLFPLG